MSDRIVSADEARERLADLEGVDPKWHGTGDSFLAAAMRTIIAQGTLVAALKVTIDQQATQLATLSRSLRIAGPMADKWAAHVDEREDDE